MKTVFAYIRLIRPLNIFIGALGVLLGAYLTGGLTTGTTLWLALGTVITFTAGANAINDYYDFAIDRINQPDRPVASGMIPRDHARRFAYLLFSTGLLAALPLDPLAILIAVSSVLLLISYSRWWKRQPVIGNVVVSLMIALAFIYGATAFGKPWAALPPAYMGFLYTWGREIIKDLEDMSGDATAEAMTLPLLSGERTAKILTTVLFLLLMAGVTLPYYLEIYNRAYFFIVMVGVNLPILYITFQMWSSHSTREYRQLSHILKADMIIGLLAVFIGTF